MMEHLIAREINRNKLIVMPEKSLKKSKLLAKYYKKVYVHPKDIKVPYTKNDLVFLDWTNASTSERDVWRNAINEIQKGN